MKSTRAIFLFITVSLLPLSLLAAPSCSSHSANLCQGHKLGEQCGNHLNEQCLATDWFFDEPECSCQSISEDNGNLSSSMVSKNVCSWLSDSECQDEFPGKVKGGVCEVSGASLSEPECSFTPNDKDAPKEQVCRWTSDYECRDKLPGVKKDGKCLVKKIVFDEPECVFIETPN